LRAYSQYGFASGEVSVMTGFGGGLRYAAAVLMKTNCFVARRNSSMSRSTSSSEKAIQSTTASQWSPTSDARISAGFATSARMARAPGMATSLRPRFSRTSSMPRSTHNLLTDALMLPVPPMKSTRMLTPALPRARCR
jgi:hypothetical protein